MVPSPYLRDSFHNILPVLHGRPCIRAVAVGIFQPFRTFSGNAYDAGPRHRFPVA